MLTHTHDPQAPDRVVVLGSRGFVGSAISSELDARGWPTEPVSSADLDLTADGAADVLAGRVRPTDALVFVSALTPSKGRDAATLERNVRMARQVAEALQAQPVAHLVNIGSDAVYADDVSLARESSCASPSSLHGVMHLVREVILMDACNNAGVPLALLRPSLLYGPADPHNGYGPNRFVRVAVSEHAVSLFGEGEEQRDHVFVEDVARLVAEVIARGSTGVLNVATGTAVSFREAAELVASLVGDTTVSGTPRQNPITHRHFDTAAAQEAFPTFRWTPLRDGLAATLDRLP